jgi:PilZ domain
MERRRHKRFDTSIPIKFRIRLPESPEVFWLNSGVLKNISGGGVYFVSNDTLPLEPGQIRDLTITPSGESLGFPSVPLINGTTRVVRIDPPLSGDHDIGVALEILSGTLFYIPLN